MKVKKILGWCILVAFFIGLFMSTVIHLMEGSQCSLLVAAIVMGAIWLVYIGIVVLLYKALSWILE